MLSLSTLMISSDDPARLVEFYTKVFGEPGWTGGPLTGWKVGNAFVMVAPHDEVKGRNETPGRHIFFLETPDVQGEFERITGLGAEVQQEPYNPGPDPNGWLATLVDPDGNYFQLASPMPAM